MRTKFAGPALAFLICIGFAGSASAQSYSFSGDMAFVSKYLWRSQLLTNDWSFQPGMTVGVGGFAFNAWGTMDLAAVNPADGGITIPEDPNVTPGFNDNGLKGQFSEIDYTFSYDHGFEDVSLGGGVIFYTFPQRSATLPSTTEIYGTIGFDAAPGAPSATVYIDVDETGEGGGTTGVYVLLSGGHTIPTSHPNFTGLDLSASLGIANSGFGNAYYGIDQSGLHDVNVTASVPIAINDNWSASGFVAYNALIGDYRAGQYPDPRHLFLGTAGSPGSYADQVWGGFTLSLGF